MGARRSHPRCGSDDESYVTHRGKKIKRLGYMAPQCPLFRFWRPKVAFLETTPKWLWGRGPVSTHSSR